VLVVAVAYVVWLYRPDIAIKVGTASTSQTLCGEIFVSGLDRNRVFAEEVQPKRGLQILLKRLRYTVDSQRQQVLTTWAGHFASVATYRQGYGCSFPFSQCKSELPWSVNCGSPLEAQELSPHYFGFRNRIRFLTATTCFRQQLRLLYSARFFVSWKAIPTF
jgi:hypothetical protein